jgi:hypothetical protein
MIFRFARDEPRPHLGTVDLHHQNLSIVRLSAVCRFWRAVAIGDAILWCNVAFSTSRSSTIRCATEFLRRSQGAVLRVQIIDIRRDVLPNIVQVSNLMDEIARQSDRIANFEAVGLSVLVAEALVYPANNLTQMTINGCGSEEIPLVFGGRLPRLRQLTLSNPSRWYLRALPSVAEVTISGCERDISINSLTDFLDGASNLEKLSLSRLGGLRTDRRNAPRPPIPLPLLRELKLAFCDPRILAHLCLPPSTQATVLTGYEPNNRHMIHYLPTADNFRSLLHDTGSLTVVLNAAGDESHLVAYRDGRASCFLQIYDENKRLDHGWITRSVDAIAEFKPFHLIESLTLSIEQCSVPWKKWFPQLERLVSMDVCSTDVEKLVRELSRTHPDQDGPLCPSLRCLSLERKGCGPALNSSVLRSCLLARSQARHPIAWLRIRGRDWTAVDRRDLGWKALIASQGRPLYIAGAFKTERLLPHTPEITGGFTTIRVND